MKKAAMIAAGVLAVGFIAIQLVPVERENPAVVAEQAFSGPEEVQAVLRTACYDCHSNETHWPFYAYVAPMSWLVAHDVEEGREHLNFSTWGLLSADDQEDLREEIWEEVEEGEMPLPAYLLTHPDARLTDEQKAVLREWGGEAERSGRDDDHD